MRRAAFATAATVVGLVALLDYKSSSPAAGTRVSVSVGQAPATTTPAATTPATAPPTTAAASASYTGEDVQYNYGDITVRITTRGGRIADITVPEESATDPRSESINSQAVPILVHEALQAQSLSFDVVSGATYTSDAFAQSLQSALQKARR